MKPIFLLLSVFIISCQNPMDKKNDILKRKIDEKHSEIKQNFIHLKQLVKESNVEDILSAKRIQTESDLSESNKRLLLIDSVLTISNKRNEDIITEINILIDSLKPTKSTNSKYINRLKSSVKKLNQTRQVYHKQDSTTINLYREIIQVLKKCDYSIVDNEIVFKNWLCEMNYNTAISGFSTIEMEARLMKLKTMNENQ